ncbi:MAG TPA: Rieske 2Fe-2S domain-containing protein [Acidimicrobiales bacterium]|nr:Rieske 2Fe-2S domain-containing protein [Acidimicrobiales bacterium]
MSGSETNIEQTAQGASTLAGDSRYSPARSGSGTSDPRYADHTTRPKTVERVIAVCFFVSLLAIAGFGADYWQNGPTILLGVFFALIFLGMGVGVIAWGKYLMPQGPFVEERHPLDTTEEDKQAFGEAFGRGSDAIKRRSFIGKLFIAINAVLGIALIIPLRSLIASKPPGKEQYNTPWGKGTRLVTINGQPVKLDALDVGGSLTVFPEGYVGSAMGQTILVRYGLVPHTTKPGRESWSPGGYLAFSKVCTHAGCPVGLYLQEFKELLCPCHQSVFNVANGATQIFGPAPRPLPQLALAQDSQGYLVSQHDYDEPVGPGFWSRGGLWNGKAS